jgi:hypothetical protein
MRSWARSEQRMKGIMNETANNIKGISAWDNFMIFLAGL